MWMNLELGFVVRQWVNHSKHRLPARFRDMPDLQQIHMLKGDEPVAHPSSGLGMIIGDGVTSLLIPHVF